MQRIKVDNICLQKTNSLLLDYAQKRGYSHANVTDAAGMVGNSIVNQHSSIATSSTFDSVTACNTKSVVSDSLDLNIMLQHKALGYVKLNKPTVEAIFAAFNVILRVRESNETGCELAAETEQFLYPLYTFTHGFLQSKSDNAVSTSFQNTYAHLVPSVSTSFSGPNNQQQSRIFVSHTTLEYLMGYIAVATAMNPIGKRFFADAVRKLVTIKDVITGKGIVNDAVKVKLEPGESHYSCCETPPLRVFTLASAIRADSMLSAAISSDRSLIAAALDNSTIELVQTCQVKTESVTEPMNSSEDPAASSTVLGGTLSPLNNQPSESHNPASQKHNKLVSRVISLSDAGGLGYHRTFFGHSGPVYKVKWSLGGQYLLSCSSDGTVRLWDPSDRDHSCRVVYRGHHYPVWDIATGSSPVSSQYFASACYDGTVRLFDAERTHPVRTFVGHNASVDVVQFHPAPDAVTSGQFLLASGSADATIRLWDARTSNCVRVLSKAPMALTGLLFHPTRPEQLITVGDDGCVHGWEIGGGARLWNAFRAHPGPIRSACFFKRPRECPSHPTGLLLATVSSNPGVLKLWSLERLMSSVAKTGNAKLTNDSESSKISNLPGHRKAKGTRKRLTGANNPCMLTCDMSNRIPLCLDSADDFTCVSASC